MARARHVLQHEISQEEAKQYFIEDFRPNLQIQEVLKTINETLARITIKDMRMPGKPILSEIFTQLEDIVEDEAVSEKRRLAEIIDIRTKGDIIREITAHAFLRTVAENGFAYVDIERLEYTEADVEFILQRLDHFVEFKMNPLFVREWTTARRKKKRTRDQAKEFICGLLADKELRKGTNIIESTARETGCSTATAHNARRELENDGKVCSPKYGLYKTKQNCRTCKWRVVCQTAAHKEVICA